MDPIGDVEGFPIFISDRNDTKYFAIVDNKKVYFGDINNDQYYDIYENYPQLNNYSMQERDRFYLTFGDQVKKRKSSLWFTSHVLYPLDVDLTEYDQSPIDSQNFSSFLNFQESSPLSSYQSSPESLTEHFSEVRLNSAYPRAPSPGNLPMPFFFLSNPVRFQRRRLIFLPEDFI